MTTEDLETCLRALKPRTALVLFDTLESLAGVVWAMHEHDILRLPEMQGEMSNDEPTERHDDADIPW